MTTAHSPEPYTNIVHETSVDGGWSGRLRIVAGTNHEGQAEPLVFVDSDLLGPRRLVLTLEQAKDVGHEISSIAFRVAHLLSSGSEDRRSGGGR